MLILQFRKATISTIRLLLIYYVFSYSSGLSVIIAAIKADWSEVKHATA